MFIIQGDKVPIKIFANQDMVESEALDQLKNASTLPFVYKHIAVMPDVHAGTGSTVGTVIPTKKAIVPACVGVDIGCGMIAMKTPFKADHLEGKLPELRHAIERAIPVGHRGHGTPLKEAENWQGWYKFALRIPTKALSQLGTLGGGNHFIEIQLDENGTVWAMLHSGSRNIGKELAEKHIDKAKDLMRKYFIKLPDQDLAYLTEGTDEFKAYWEDLQWAQQYAMQSRHLMMQLVHRQLVYTINKGEDFTPELLVNCHHNYTELEHHFGENIYVTRKGAIRARTDDFGIIPGSMGTGSYIVKGKGEPESFNSCSHGAGRKMSRTKAKATFTVEDLKRQTEGVECRKDEGVIDEIPGAYKDINNVMECQTDLVEVVAKLKQVLCIKG
jgi:tRNA-splicing ligase RtcB